MRRAATRPWFWPGVVGLFAGVVTGAGVWVPSLWGDEAASIMSAQRSWPSLFELLGHIDAVHGTYYALLHVWIDAFGASTFSVRLPSVLAVGFAAAGIVVLVRRLGDARLAVLAGILFGLLPRTSYMAAEARSYALSATVAVWLTVLLVALVQRRDTRWMSWAGYAAGLAFGTYLFLYLAMLVVVHGVVLAFARSGRAVVARWGLAVVGAAVLALPVGYFAITEREQIAFLGWTNPVTPSSFFVDQWFGGNVPLAVVCWILVAAAAVAVIVRARRVGPRPRAAGRLAAGRPAAASRPAASPGLLAVLAFAWFAIPQALLLIADRFVPLYTLRYTSFVAPALAIVLAIGVVAVARVLVGMLRRLPRPSGGRLGLASGVAILLVALTAVATPTLVAQRGPFAKDLGSDWAQIAQLMHENARPGDAVAFTQKGRPSRSPRLAMRVYPDAFAGLRDVTLTSPFTRNRSLRDHTRTIAQSEEALSRGDGRLWLIQYVGPKGSATERAEQFAALRAQGFHLVRTIRAHRDILYLFENERAAARPVSTGGHDGIRGDSAPAVRSAPLP